MYDSLKTSATSLGTDLWANTGLPSSRQWEMGHVQVLWHGDERLVMANGVVHDGHLRTLPIQVHHRPQTCKNSFSKSSYIKDEVALWWNGLKFSEQTILITHLNGLDVYTFFFIIIIIIAWTDLWMYPCSILNMYFIKLNLIFWLDFNI